MATSDRMVRFVTQLNRLTQEGEIQWSSRDVPRSLREGTDEMFPVFFAATYRDRNLGICEVRSRGYQPEFDSMYWHSGVVLSFYDHEWTLLMRYEELASGLPALLESVQRQVAGVDEFIDDILPKEEEEESE